MPPWGETLSPSDLRSLVKYVRTLCQCEQPGWAGDDRVKGLTSLAVLLAFVACNTSDEPRASGTKAPVIVADASPPDTVLKSKPAAPKKPTFGKGAISPEKQASFDDLEKLPRRGPASENDFLGSSACRSCHQDKYSIWQASTHGRAGGKPSKDLVIPSFDNVELVFKDAVVRLTDKKGDYAFHVTENGRRNVALMWWASWGVVEFMVVQPRPILPK